jgi:hypothetical protein
MTKVKTSDGLTHNVKDIDFTPLEESWATYKLEDGSVVKLRMTLVAALKSDQYDSSGNPIYLLTNQAAQRILVPEKNKIEPKETKTFDQPPSEIYR